MKLNKREQIWTVARANMRERIWTVENRREWKTAQCCSGYPLIPRGGVTRAASQEILTPQKTGVQKQKKQGSECNFIIVALIDGPDPLNGTRRMGAMGTLRQSMALARAARRRLGVQNPYSLE